VSFYNLVKSNKESKAPIHIVSRGSAPLEIVVGVAAVRLTILLALGFTTWLVATILGMVVPSLSAFIVAIGMTVSLLVAAFIQIDVTTP